MIRRVVVDAAFSEQEKGNRRRRRAPAEEQDVDERSEQVAVIE